MNQNVHSDGGRNDLQPGWECSWTSEGSPRHPMSYLAVTPPEYDPRLLHPLERSIGSSSGRGFDQWTPQGTLPDESLPGDSLSAPQGSEEASSQSLSLYTDTGESLAAHDVAFHGIAWFGSPNFHSIGPDGQVLDGMANEMTNLVDGMAEPRSWRYEDQAFAFDDRCEPMRSIGERDLPGEPLPSAGEHQERSVEDILSGILPEQYLHIRSQDHFMASNSQVPRYIPFGSPTTAPWSAYSIPDDQIRRRPHPDEVLFAPEQRDHTGLLDLECIPQQTEGKTKKRKDTLKARPSNHGGRDYYLDNVGRPPSGNPVGPPPDVFEQSHAIDTLPPDRMMEAQRKGGRHGKLGRQSREDARRTRKIGSCWNCVFVRGKCIPIGTGMVCQGCITTVCDRTHLSDLSNVFLPASLLDQHRVSAIKDFCRARVYQWTDNRLIVHLTWGYGAPIVCHVEEFNPLGDSLLYQNQYQKDLDTGDLNLVKTPSPPLGMTLIHIGHCRLYLSAYLDKLLDEDFEGFPEACYRGSDCKVQRDLLYVLHHHHVVTKNDLLALCLKLIALTHIATHSMTLVEETRAEVSRSLRNQPVQDYGIQTSPRWLNRQLKFLLSSLHVTLMETILEKLTQMLRRSKKKSTWEFAFSTILMLAMASESIQITLRCKEATDKEEGTIDPHNDTARQASIRIDERFAFLQDLFHRGYKTAGAKGKPTFSPVHNATDRAELDVSARQLAERIGEIVESHRDFLESRQDLDVPTATESKSSRLVARFLLSF